MDRYAGIYPGTEGAQKARGYSDLVPFIPNMPVLRATAPDQVVDIYRLLFMISALPGVRS